MPVTQFAGDGTGLGTTQVTEPIAKSAQDIRIVHDRGRPNLHCTGYSPRQARLHGRSTSMSGGTPAAQCPVSHQTILPAGSCVETQAQRSLSAATRNNPRPLLRLQGRAFRLRRVLWELEAAGRHPRLRCGLACHRSTAAGGSPAGRRVRPRPARNWSSAPRPIARSSQLCRSIPIPTRGAWRAAGRTAPRSAGRRVQGTAERPRMGPTVPAR